MRERVARAASVAGRDPKEITIVAAAKNQPLERVLEALECGITAIGENRVQEAASRQAEVRARFPKTAIHMIGHLQRNKVRQALDIFDIIQSLDSERLAREISARAKEIPVLVEVKTSEEAAKSGVPAEAAPAFLEMVSGLGNIKVKGLMTVAPLSDDPEKARPYFAGLRELSEKIKTLNLPNVEMQYLSMGMTDDLEAAIQEGSNLIRVGRAIFGQRS